MDLDRRVAQTRGQGGDAIISFGGQANTELAMACDDAGKLGSAYKSVVERYTADTIDFDIEGEALHDTAANARRATAVKALQDEIRADGGRLAVWLTLPVTPDGLNPDALAVVRTMTRREGRRRGRQRHGDGLRRAQRRQGHAAARSSPR